MRNHFRPPLGELFEDLMYQSGLTAQGCWDEIDDYGREAIEKLAVLIVEECLSYMKDGDIDFAKWMIKKNFGVEE